jgi:predicted aspartyl protease
MIFPYVEFVGLTEERIFRPMIPITFKSNKTVFNTYALIDSGSDYTILPIEVAGLFNFSLTDQPRYTIGSAGGSSFTVYRSPEELNYVLKKRGFRDIQGKSLVYYAESCPTTLIGQSGILNNLNVRLDGNKRIIEIKK